VSEELTVPREHVYGDVVTVHDGDLRVLRARSRDDLLDLHLDDAADVVTAELRRRVASGLDGQLDLRSRRRRRDENVLRAFATGVRSALDAATEDDGPVRMLALLRDLRRRLAVLDDALAQPASSDDDTAGDTADEDAFVPARVADPIRRDVAELVLLRQFVRDVADLGAAEDLDPVARGHVMRLVGALGAQLLELHREADAPAAPSTSGLPVQPEPTETGDDRDAATDITHTAAVRRVQLRLALTWERDARQLVVGVDGWDHDRAEAVDLGGLRVSLDWAATNRAIKLFRVGRDRSNGTPE
jgi:hypothetical protein